MPANNDAGNRSKRKAVLSIRGIANQTLYLPIDVDRIFTARVCTHMHGYILRFGVLQGMESGEWLNPIRMENV